MTSLSLDRSLGAQKIRLLPATASLSTDFPEQPLGLAADLAIAVDGASRRSPTGQSWSARPLCALRAKLYALDDMPLMMSHNSAQKELAHGDGVGAGSDVLCAESFEPGTFGVQIAGMNVQVDVRRAGFQTLHEQHQVVPAGESSVMFGGVDLLQCVLGSEAADRAVLAALIRLPSAKLGVHPKIVGSLQVPPGQSSRTFCTLSCGAHPARLDP